MHTRHKQLLALLERAGEMTIKDLADALRVSAMTVHRDLDLLETQRLLYKKRGAAVFVAAPDRDVGDFYAEEKRLIGTYAASLIHPGQSVLLDNSTTVLEAAKALRDIPGLTVYTTSLEAADILAGCPDMVLYCSGGYYFADSHGFVGRQAEEFVARIRADVCLIGASGIDLQAGITNPYPMHSALERRIIEAADQCLLLADHSKFGRRAAEKAADLAEIDRIVTDGGLDPALRAAYGAVVPLDIV